MKERHQEFAKLVASGVNPAVAYVSVGYSDKSPAQSGSKLAKHPKVFALIQQLRGEIRKVAIERAAEKMSLTRDWVIQECMDNVRLAKTLDDKGRLNLAAANQALEMLGREIGMFRTGVDHTMQWDGDPSKLTAGQLAKLKAHFEGEAFGGDTAAMEKFKADYLAAVAASEGKPAGTVQ